LRLCKLSFGGLELVLELLNFLVSLRKLFVLGFKPRLDTLFLELQLLKCLLLLLVLSLLLLELGLEPGYFCLQLGDPFLKRCCFRVVPLL
jgi:hypothetical protein